MSNPMMAQMPQSNVANSQLGQAVSQAQSIMTPMQAAANPMMLNQLAAQNPMLSQVMQMVQQSGGNAKAAFYNAAQSLGIDPNSVLPYMRQMFPGI